MGGLAVFNIALTLYGCTQFYAYLPTSDTWIYVDFLARAAQGQLDIATLFDKHNGAHVIALPKLVYFLDVWLTHGSGVLTLVISLLAQLASALLFFFVIKQTEGLDKTQKIFLSITSAIFLLSACQAESLLNPANLQWSLLVFSAVITACCIWRYLRTKAWGWIVGIVVGVLLVSLTSASPLLILLPIIIVFFRKVPIKNAYFMLTAVLVIGGTIVGVVVSQNISIEWLPALLKNGLKIMVDFMAPPVERLHYFPATFLTGILLMLSLWKVLGKNSAAALRENIFFNVLLWFSLFLIVTTGIVRSYSPAAFTFRFVNIGLLFSLTLLMCLYFQVKGQRAVSVLVAGIFAYLLLLSYINYKEVSAFGYGRNHVRLNQVAYALDIRDSGVVSALPGTVWEKSDYDFVQANKHKLEKQGLGIYSDSMYRKIGASITTVVEDRQTQACTVDILKMRRLLPDQATYKLTGRANTHDGQKLSRVIFTDREGVMRGFAIPVLSSRDLWQSIREGRNWSGFVNLDNANDTQSLQAYAYGDRIICEPTTIELPVFQPFIKKQKNKN